MCVHVCSMSVTMVSNWIPLSGDWRRRQKRIPIEAIRAFHYDPIDAETYTPVYARSHARSYVRTYLRTDVHTHTCIHKRIHAGIHKDIRARIHARYITQTDEWID